VLLQALPDETITGVLKLLNRKLEGADCIAARLADERLALACRWRLRLMPASHLGQTGSSRGPLLALDVRLSLAGGHESRRGLLDLNRCMTIQGGAYIWCCLRRK